MLGKNFINILSDQKLAKYNYGFITEEFLKSVINDFNKIFYLCGPPPMMDAIEKQLANLQVYNYGFITEEFLKSVINDFNKIFYLCGATADDGCNRKAVSQFAGE